MDRAELRALVYAGWIASGVHPATVREARTRFYLNGGTLALFVALYCDLARVYYA